MELQPLQPPRRFLAAGTEIADCGTLVLGDDELVTLCGAGGGGAAAEAAAPGAVAAGGWEVVRKSWGWYATPSLGQRLAASGLRAALAESVDGKRFVLLVEHGGEDGFQAYLGEQGLRLLGWLDEPGLPGAGG